MLFLSYRFYSDFDFYSYSIHSATGTKLKKDTLKKQFNINPSLLTIVDPFEPQHNLTSRVRIEGLGNFQSLCFKFCHSMDFAQVCNLKKILTHVNNPLKFKNVFHFCFCRIDNALKKFGNNDESCFSPFLLEDYLIWLKNTLSDYHASEQSERRAFVLKDFPFTQSNFTQIEVENIIGKNINVAQIHYQVDFSKLKKISKSEKKRIRNPADKTDNLVDIVINLECFYFTSKMFVLKYKLPQNFKAIDSIENVFKTVTQCKQCDQR